MPSIPLYMTHENLKKIIYYDAHDLMMKIKCY